MNPGQARIKWEVESNKFYNSDLYYIIVLAVGIKWEMENVHGNTEVTQKTIVD